MNPYLPLWEYVPDGEPRIWGDRLYVYGSHDVAGSTQFCEGDYVVWSAPLDDLGSWKYEGISYPYTATTASLEEGGNLAAPDCVQGPDGRYYLYYNRGKYDPCEVAVSNTPQGPFTYLCNVTFPDGTMPTTKMFDPGVLVDDDGRIYLYIGFCPTSDFPWALKLGKYSLGFELEPDMHTIKAGPFEVLPGCQATAGTGFEGHGFYEASSPRKIGKRYYLVYSSEQSHDLCYAVSDQPLTARSKMTISRYWIFRYSPVSLPTTSSFPTISRMRAATAAASVSIFVSRDLSSSSSGAWSSSSRSSVSYALCHGSIFPSSFFGNTAPA